MKVFLVPLWMVDQFKSCYSNVMLLGFGQKWCNSIKESVPGTAKTRRNFHFHLICTNILLETLGTLKGKNVSMALTVPQP